GEGSKNLRSLSQMSAIGGSSLNRTLQNLRQCLQPGGVGRTLRGGGVFFQRWSHLFQISTIPLLNRSPQRGNSISRQSLRTFELIDVRFGHCEISRPDDLLLVLHVELRHANRFRGVDLVLGQVLRGRQLKDV